jgi:hypothetical protein
MPNAWVAVDAGVDPVSWARLLRKAHTRALDPEAGDGTAPPSIVRDVVRESWARAQAAGVALDERPPIMVDRDEAGRVLHRHALADLVPVVETVLVDVARYAEQVVGLTNADGLVLWTAGHEETLRAAEHAHLMPGVLWSEDAAGTNAVGTALRLDHPLQIFSAEHFKKPLHGWSSTAAPVHDPESGATLGAVCLSGAFRAAHPHGFSLVVAAAQIMEAHLLHEATRRDERLMIEYVRRVQGDGSSASAVVNRAGAVVLQTPNGWLGSRLRIGPDGVPMAPADEELTIEPLPAEDGFLVRRGGGGPAQRAKLRLEALGRDRVAATVGGHTVALSPRHGEILVILARHPDGLDEEELAAALYGSRVKIVTVRAEISRLRKVLGPIVKTRPYRLAADVAADFLELEAELERGGAAGAARAAGELLPASRAPEVVAMRRRLQDAIACSAPAP